MHLCVELALAAFGHRRCAQTGEYSAGDSDCLACWGHGRQWEMWSILVVCPVLGMVMKLDSYFVAAILCFFCHDLHIGNLPVTCCCTQHDANYGHCGLPCWYLTVAIPVQNPLNPWQIMGSMTK